MIADSRPPFRWTAAWVTGKMGNPEFVPLLEEAACDPEPGVQTAAMRALDAIQKLVVSTAEKAQVTLPEPVLVPADPVTAADPEPAPAAQPLKPEEPEPASFDFDLHLDGTYTSTRL